MAEEITVPVAERQKNKGHGVSRGPERKIKKPRRGESHPSPRPEKLRIRVWLWPYRNKRKKPASAAAHFVNIVSNLIKKTILTTLKTPTNVRPTFGL